MILNDKIEVKDLINKIERIGDELHSFTIKLVFSFADISTYSNVRNRLIHNNINYQEWDKGTMTEFAQELKNLKEMNVWDLELTTCSESIDLSYYGIKHNSCIDVGQITKIAYLDNVLMNHLGIKGQILHYCHEYATA